MIDTLIVFERPALFGSSGVTPQNFGLVACCIRYSYGLTVCCTAGSWGVVDCCTC